MASSNTSMAAYMDLNIKFTPNANKLKRLLETAAQLGYSTVAINYEFEPKGKQKKDIPKPVQLAALLGELPVPQGKCRPIRVLNRLTVVVSDVGHFRQPSSEHSAFDLLAVLPTNEKVFHAACTMMNIDIVCLIMNEKLPFHFKSPPVNAAVERGVMFEVCYAAAIRDSTMRRYSLGNSLHLVERCKGKNVVVSSGTDQPMELRGPYDIINLSLLFGLTEKDAKQSVSFNCRSALLHGETRRTASGVVYTVKTPLVTSSSPLPTEGDAVTPPANSKGDTETPPAKSKGDAETPPAKKSKRDVDPPPAKKSKGDVDPPPAKKSKA